MKLAKYRELRDRVRRSIDYWLALTRIEFVGDVVRIMDEDDVSRSEMARRMETSQPYISKALNGNDNFTLRTMIKFAQALDAVLHVRLAKSGEIVRVLKAKGVSVDLDSERVYAPPKVQRRPVWTRQAVVAHGTPAPVASTASGLLSAGAGFTPGVSDSGGGAATQEAMA